MAGHHSGGQAHDGHGHSGYPLATTEAPPAGAQDATGGSTWEVGLRYLKNKQYARAAATLVRAVMADPENGLPKLDFADALFAVGDYDYAAIAVRRGLDRVPDVARAVANRQSRFSDPDELERVLYGLREHVRRDPDHGDARFLLGYYRYVAGQYDDAGRTFDQVLEAHPGDRHAAQLRDLTRSVAK